MAGLASCTHILQSQVSFQTSLYFDGRTETLSYRKRLLSPIFFAELPWSSKKTVQEHWPYSKRSWSRRKHLVQDRSGGRAPAADRSDNAGPEQELLQKKQLSNDERKPQVSSKPTHTCNFSSEFFLTCLLLPPTRPLLIKSKKLCFSPGQCNGPSGA